MRILFVLAAAGLALATLPAAAAPFDGKWIADIPSNGPCNYTATLTLVVADGAVQGQVRNPGNVRALEGHIDADGTVNFSVNHAPGTGKFAGDHFDITWFNGHCNRHAEGDRAPDAGQLAAAAQARKQHQAAFSELVRRAQAGEKIDFTALRAEYVYSEGWNFYGNKINGLMTEAQAAAKGKDCPAVLEKTDQLLKLDFTVAQAHVLRSTCIEDSDRPLSRIESAIAEGLDDSLMNSGDGDSEKTAYVVSTLHEEMRALIKRGIQIKARQTQVRGSDGHFYDQIQGIAISSGFENIRITSKTVFFNVDSFATGRESLRAAVTQATAAMQ